MNHTRTTLAVLPVAAALLLSACSSSADIEAEQADTSDAGASQALVVDTSPEQADRVQHRRGPGRRGARARRDLRRRQADRRHRRRRRPAAGVPRRRQQHRRGQRGRHRLAGRRVARAGARRPQHLLGAVAAVGAERRRRGGVQQRRRERRAAAAVRLRHLPAGDHGVHRRPGQRPVHHGGQGHRRADRRGGLGHQPGADPARLEQGQRGGRAGAGDAGLLRQRRRRAAGASRPAGSTPTSGRTRTRSTRRTRARSRSSARSTPAGRTPCTSRPPRSRATAWSTRSQAGLQHAFDDGSYADTLTRWGLSDEAVDEPVVNPQVAS